MIRDPKNLRPGEHQKSEFIPAGSKHVQYDYRDLDGELFSCVKRTLDACTTARQEWLDHKVESLAITFLKLLRNGSAFDCELIIGNVDMPASFVWDEKCKITDYGIEKFKPLMDAKCRILANGNIEIFCDDWELGESFAWAAAGYIADSEFKKIFGNRYINND